jgi:hypothetical protein
MEVGTLTPYSVSALPAAASRGRHAAVEKTAAEATPVAREPRREVVEQALADRREALRAGQEARREQALQAASGGSIQFEQAEGTRIMKVLDSKDVLIYQVPPKGELMLVRAEEAADRRAPIKA